MTNAMVRTQPSRVRAHRPPIAPATAAGIRASQWQRSWGGTRPERSASARLDGNVAPTRARRSSALADHERPLRPKRGTTVHGAPANAGHRVLAPDDAEVEAYLEVALDAPPPERSAQDRPGAGAPGSPQVIEPDTVIVLDFGSQFAQLIARRVRELHVYSELLPHDTPWAEIERRRPTAIILSGGPSSVYDDDAPRPDPGIWSGRIPVLGICYGAQLMARELGGDVLPVARREYGPATVTITADDSLFTGLERQQPVWMSHGDSITRLPAGFRATAQTDSTPYAGLVDPERGLYGIQFHPEVAHTPCGRDVLRNFVLGIAGARATWTPASFIESTVAAIKARVEAHARGTGSDGKVICALSGGVDSAVAAALVHRAVGDRLTCIYVDHGLMRKRESELLRVTFEQNLGMRLVMVDARQRFLARLAGVEDPEEKRRIIGDAFIRVFEEEAARIGRIDFLTQGTLYPDVIESTAPETKAAQKIKTHHNVGGLPADLRFQLIEPLRYLFKDEVRAVGLELGLPEVMVNRQPFPGPGLAIRIIGEVTAERLDTLREADWIVIDEIKAAGLYRSVWQSFAILTPVRSVGVMGDGRTYANVVAIRAVTSEDGMTADWAKLPYDVLGKISSRIVNEVPGVNRVVYDISSKPPATIEWE
ncbi:MAG: GMP synthase, GMP synthase (glutamine-hydrolysing) [Chloroflexi bacterium CSP1-4]|nr:MAG: GMP synthase, GMP synthase (glutamine-hydrolysing) [Chloroflexi bacterium CSP1-4]